MTQDEIEIIADAVTNRMLEAPSGAEVCLNVHGMKSSFVTSLPGVPRIGEVVWHRPRRNSKPRRFMVRAVEWWDSWPNRRVDIFLDDAPA